MDDYYKAGHERLRELGNLHHNAIGTMLRFIKEKEETEMEMWNTLKRILEEEAKNGKPIQQE